MSIKPVLCAAAIATFLSSPALADVSRESLRPPQPGLVYKIELLNLRPLSVKSVNDSDREDELHRVTVKLITNTFGSSGEILPQPQFDQRTYTRQNLWGSNGRVANVAYLPIRRGDSITLSNATSSDTSNLWVLGHARGRPSRTMGFQIEITSRELDCAGTRVCRRGDTGTYTFVGLLGSNIPTARTCTNTNTYKIQPVDGKMTLLNPPAARFGSVSNFFERTSGDGPKLALFNADICVTTTWGEESSSTSQKTFEKNIKVEPAPELRKRIGRELKRPQG